MGYEVVLEKAKPKKPTDDEVSVKDDITVLLYKEAA
jgi:hypothetical protein